MVLHEIGHILEFKKTNPKDYVALFFHPLKNDLIEILDRLQIHMEEVKDIDDNFHSIKVKGEKHPMKKNRIWSWYEISIPSEERTIFVVYSMKKKDLDRKGGF